MKKPGASIGSARISVSKKSILTFLFTLQNRRKVLLYRLFCDNILYSRRAFLPPPSLSPSETSLPAGESLPLELPCYSVFRRRSIVF